MKTNLTVNPKGIYEAYKPAFKIIEEIRMALTRYKPIPCTARKAEGLSPLHR